MICGHICIHVFCAHVVHVKCNATIIFFTTRVPSIFQSIYPSILWYHFSGALQVFLWLFQSLFWHIPLQYRATLHRPHDLNSLTQHSTFLHPCALHLWSITVPLVVLLALLSLPIIAAICCCIWSIAVVFFGKGTIAESSTLISSPDL